MFNQEQLIFFTQLFDDLNQEELLNLLRIARFKKISKGEIYIHYGSTEQKLCYIQKGIMRAYFIQEDGLEKTFMFQLEMELVASVDVLFRSEPSKYVFEAMEDCSVWEVNYDELDKFIDNNPKFHYVRKHFLQNLILESFDRVQSFVSKTPEERYIELKSKADLTLRVQDKYIASYLGITNVSLSRIKKRIKEKMNDN